MYKSIKLWIAMMTVSLCAPGRNISYGEGSYATQPTQEAEFSIQNDTHEPVLQDLFTQNSTSAPAFALENESEEEAAKTTQFSEIQEAAAASNGSNSPRTTLN